MIPATRNHSRLRATSAPLHLPFHHFSLPLPTDTDSSCLRRTPKSCFSFDRPLCQTCRRSRRTIANANAYLRQLWSAIVPSDDCHRMPSLLASKPSNNLRRLLQDFFHSLSHTFSQPPPCPARRNTTYTRVHLHTHTHTNIDRQGLGGPGRVRQGPAVPQPNRASAGPRQGLAGLGMPGPGRALAGLSRAWQIFTDSMLLRTARGRLSASLVSRSA